MKTLLLVPLAFLVTSCISLPTLTEENQALVTELSFYLCEADKAGLLQENAEITPEQLQQIVAQFQAEGGRAPSITPEQLEQKMNTLSEDPIQLALFAQALVMEQMNCRGNANTN